jgi:hypothetical protein
MKSIHIKSVDPKTLERLKRLARSHHRSLQGELHVILERAARLAPPDDREIDLQLVTVDVGGDRTWNREEIYGADGR